MRLIYIKDGSEVKVGDKVNSDGDVLEVTFFRKPSSPASSGKVSVKDVEDGFEREYYVSVIGAEWVEREDRLEVENGNS